MDRLFVEFGELFRAFHKNESLEWINKNYFRINFYTLLDVFFMSSFFVLSITKRAIQPTLNILTILTMPLSTWSWLIIIAYR